MMNEIWRLSAACRGLDTAIFFPFQGGSSKRAKAICSECSVKKQCLTYAMESPTKFGVWGGMSEKERRIKTRNDNKLKQAG
jgi:WhiB family transcriptional regulator, redox-sensing transcriptional regulator